MLGFTEAAREETTLRFRASGGLGGLVDIREAGEVLPGWLGAGSVHHIAFRAVDYAAQAAMRKRLAENHMLGMTDQQDRTCFRSLHFREPGGVLFEIATDIPGFTVDEAPTALGSALKLPA